jgi:hypothetical protein
VLAIDLMRASNAVFVIGVPSTDATASSGTLPLLVLSPPHPAAAATSVNDAPSARTMRRVE